MKFKLLLVALMCSVFSWGQILTFNFDTLAGGEATANSNFNDPNLTASTISRGAGLTASANGGRFNATSWALTSIANAVTGNDYMEFTITPNVGYEFSVSSVVIRFQRSATGPSALVLRNSLDGYATNLDTQYAITDNTSTQTFTFTFSQANTATAVTYRLYAYAEAGTGTGGPGDDVVNDDIVVNGVVTSTAPCTTPTSQASSITNTNTTTTTVDLSWSPAPTANGSIVVIRPASSGNSLPVNGTNYLPSTAWGSAAQIDPNNRVLYRSNGASVTGVSGLSPGTQYTVTVYSYNGSGVNICYNTSNPETYNFYTLANEPSAFGTGFTGCTTVSVSSISLNFAAANTITNATGYIILYREGALPTGVPTDGVIYSPGSIIGDSTVDNYVSAAATSRTVSGLNAGATYYFLLVPHGSNVAPETLNYRTVATIPSTNCNTSIAPEINVRGVVGTNPTIPDNDVTPQGTDNTLFATVVVGNNQAKNFRIENTGNSVLNITNIFMVGGNTSEFVVSGITLPTTIAAGTSLDFTVTFTPAGAGIRSTTLRIDNNDTNENPYNFVIQGTGTLVALVEMNVKGNGQSIPDNSIYPLGTNHTAFGVATVGGTPVVRTFTIENLGSTALNLTGTPYVTVTGPHASLFTVIAQPSSNAISGGASLTFDVEFDPNSPGAKNATIVIANSDADENPYNFNISGTAKGTNNIYAYGNGNDVVKGSTTTALTNLTSFGSVAVTSGIKQNTFVVSNLSGVTTYLSNVTITGADAAMYSVVAQPTNNGLGSGNSTSFTINFTPTSTGIKNAIVSFNVYTDAARTVAEPIDPIYTFSISGNGIVFSPCTNNVVQTIFIQDFESIPASPTLGYTYTTDGVVTLAGGTYFNGVGNRDAYLGARSIQFTGTATAVTRTAVINLNPIDVSSYNNINLSLRVGAFNGKSTPSYQGLDVNDLIQIESSVDGGVNWSTESVLRGYADSTWDFNATGVFNAYYTGTNNGATLDSRNGGLELPSGYSTYNLKNLPSSPNLLLRITLVVNRADEIWAIDDIKIEGQLPVITTWDGATWSAGAPNVNTKAIFDGPYNTATHGDVQACECEIKSGRTVQITAGNYIESQSDIINNGTLSIANNGSLVQVNDDAVNTGTISYERIASLRRSDYVYWSSPLEGYTIDNISPATPSNFIWKWNTTANNVNGGLGTWVSAAGNIMGSGEGFIVRGPNTFNDAALQNLTVTFSGGKQNNGIISVPISRGAMVASTLATYTSANGIPFTVNDDNWNLIGNPYPSAIRALDFLNANTNIEGAVRLWTHGALPAAIINPFYGSYQYNYTVNDYIVHNGTGTVSGPAGFNGYIAGGQAFFVLMNEGTAATSTVQFTNLMRSRTYDNSQFYRNSNQVNAGEEKSRIWLDLVNANQNSVRTLIGYIDGATEGRDRLFDAFAPTTTSQSIYSLINNERMHIQGRPTPFDQNDAVQLGVVIPQTGQYTIAIAATDGIFAENQNVFLEDKVLNVTHDLKSAPYSFSSDLGTFNERFELRYTNNALTNPEFDATNNVMIVSDELSVVVRSTIENISQIEVFDVLGRSILKSKNDASQEVVLSKQNIKNQAVIVKVLLESGQVITKKIVL
jgi:hypothetical protein